MNTKTITGQIREIAFALLEDKPEGIRYSELGRKILEINPSFMPNTISGATWDLDIKFQDKVYKPDRGVFRLTKFKEDVAIQPDQLPATTVKITTKKTIKEED